MSRLSCRQEKNFAVFSRLFICPEKIYRHIQADSLTTCLQVKSINRTKLHVLPLHHNQSTAYLSRICSNHLAPWERDAIWTTPQVKTFASTSTTGQRLWRDKQIKTSHQVTWPRCRNTKTRDAPPSESISRNLLHPRSYWTTERGKNPDKRSAFKPKVCKASRRGLDDTSRAAEADH